MTCVGLHGSVGALETRAHQSATHHLPEKALPESAWGSSALGLLLSASPDTWGTISDSAKNQGP